MPLLLTVVALSVHPRRPLTTCVVCTQPALVAGKTVLEVGTGLGIAGICAALAGASAVLATDHEPHSLVFTDQNALENGVDERMQTARLDWTEPTSDALLKERFDVLVAADVLYEDDTAPEVARLMRELVKPRGTAIFSDGRDRIYLEEHTKELLRLLQAGGEFEVRSSVELDVSVAEDGGGEREMRVVVLERKHVFPNPSRKG